MKALLPGILLAASCAMAFGGSHRPVGFVQKPLADADAITAVEVVNLAGRVRIEAGAPAVSAEVRLRDDRDPGDFEPVFEKHVDLARDGGKLVVQDKHLGSPDAQDWQLHLVVRVPAGVAVRVRQTAGSVEVALPASGDVEVENTTGAVSVAVPRLDGALLVDVTTGEIDAAVVEAGPSRGAAIRCATGQASLSLPADLDAEFALAVTTGGIEVAPRYGFEPERSMVGAKAAGATGAGGPKIEMTVVTGQVSLR